MITMHSLKSNLLHFSIYGMDHVLPIDSKLTVSAVKRDGRTLVQVSSATRADYYTVMSTEDANKLVIIIYNAMLQLCDAKSITNSTQGNT